MKDKDYEISISMLDFLINYVSLDEMVDSETIKKLEKATHRDIKELNIPYVKTVPFEIVNKESILNGSILYVYDGKSTKKNKRVAPYIRPEILKEEERRKEGKPYERKLYTHK